MSKRYAVTDIHGMWDLWQAIKDYCQPDDTIYFLGDAADRGTDGLRVIQDLLKDPRVVYLKGNHEDMLAMVISDALQGYTENLLWWAQNGGRETYEQLVTLSVEELTKLYRTIEVLPDHLTIENTKGQTILLSHAGTSPDYTTADLLLVKGEAHYLWDRKHVMRPWPQDDKFKDLYIVHGHTPCMYMLKQFNNWRAFCGEEYISNDKIEIVKYADGHKFNLDLGSFMTNKIALFDLDELKVEKYFEFPITDFTWV